MKQSREAASLSEIQSSYKGDNSPPTLRAMARGDPKKGAWHKCRSLFCFAPCLALRSATTSCIEMVTTHSVRLFRPLVARPYESLAFRQRYELRLKAIQKRACACVLLFLYRILPCSPLRCKLGNRNGDARAVCIRTALAIPSPRFAGLLTNPSPSAISE